MVYTTQNTGASGLTLIFRASGEGMMVEKSVATNSSGYANANLMSLTSGIVTVTASIAARTPQELTANTTFVEP
ncbi:Ig-like domain-containing protein [Enterobacter cloacae subsp. dissolvens]